MAQSETDQIIGQMTDATVRIIDSNLELMKRVGRTDSKEPPSNRADGTAQDIWMTWAETAGDLVQISYLTAQLIDTMWGPTRSSPKPT